MIGEVRGGAIYLEGSNLEVSGRVNFEGNKGSTGGGICIGNGTRWESINSSINFIGNKAGGLG